MKLTITAILVAFSFILQAQHSLEWAKNFGNAPQSIILPDIESAVDAFGNVYAVGGFRDSADFDPGPGIFNLTSNGFNDIFIQKLDSAGNLKWVKQIGGTGYEYAEALTLDDQGNIYISGSFEDSLDFDPGPNTLTFYLIPLNYHIHSHPL